MMTNQCTFIDRKGNKSELSIAELFQRIPPETICSAKETGPLEVEIEYYNNGIFDGLLFQDGVVYPPAGAGYRRGYMEVNVDLLSDEFKSLLGI